MKSGNNFGIIQHLKNRKALITGFLKRSMVDNSNSLWKWVHYLAVAVFGVLSVMLLTKTVSLTLKYLIYWYNLRQDLATDVWLSILLNLLFGLVFLFHLLNSLFAVLYGVFSRKREGDFREWAYSISVVVFCILSFAVLIFAVLAGFSRDGSPIWLLALRGFFFPLPGQILYGLITVFAVLYPMFRLKKGLRI